VVNKTAQESYQADLGTSVAAGGLLSVAVKEYGAKQLKVFFRPVSPLLTQNANAQSCVLAKTVTATRRLSQTSSYTVTNPGTWSYTAALSSGGSLGGGERTAAATGDLTINTEGLTDVSADLLACLLHACMLPACFWTCAGSFDNRCHWLKLPAQIVWQLCKQHLLNPSGDSLHVPTCTVQNLPQRAESQHGTCCCLPFLLQDRNYCATISVVLKGYTVSGAPAGFPTQITLPFTICFYKHNGQATAKFNFGSCGAGGGGHPAPQHACAWTCLHMPSKGLSLACMWPKLCCCMGSIVF
jgi:hypothetical protein